MKKIYKKYNKCFYVSLDDSNKEANVFSSNR